MKTLTAAAAVSLLALLASACSLSTEDELTADEESATVSSALDTGMSASELENLTSADASLAARSLAAGETKDCKTRTLDAEKPNVVHVKLTHCSGRFGRRVVDGDITVTFTANADGSLHAEHVSDSLTIDGRPATRVVSADITFTAEGRRVVRRATKTGTNARGHAFTRRSEEVVLVDRASRCRTINGAGVANFESGRIVESKITDLRLCEDAAGVDLCPTGVVAHSNASANKQVTQRFDGSSTSQVEIVRPKGNETRTWSLDCAPLAAQ
ncbi:MAG: hypothetical protein IPF92_04805 [Myxococcales bacterium]|nr:hypothetical protein [Myxococcales bacterium]